MENPETQAALGTRRRTYKRQRKSKGQIRMDNPETQAALGTIRKTQRNKTKKRNTEN